MEQLDSLEERVQLAINEHETSCNNKITHSEYRFADSLSPLDSFISAFTSLTAW